MEIEIQTIYIGLWYLHTLYWAWVIAAELLSYETDIFFLV